MHVIGEGYGLLWVEPTPAVLRPTHLQVKELAVPPVDGLGRGVRPGHIDDVYLGWKGKAGKVIKAGTGIT